MAKQILSNRGEIHLEIKSSNDLRKDIANNLLKIGGFFVNIFKFSILLNNFKVNYTTKVLLAIFVINVEERK